MSMAPVLIIGATGGVGSALARMLAARGMPLVLTGRSEDAVGALAAETGGQGVVCNVLDSTSLEAAIAVATAGGEGLAGLAFCVGSIQLAPLKRQTRESLRQAFELNVVSAAEAVRLAEPPLKQAKGSVVLFSTVAVAQGFSNHVAISAAKGGVEGLTRALAADLAPAVRVNAVAPSLLRTKIAGPLTANEAMANSIAALHALPRLGEGADAAGMAAFLLGPDSSWITGQVFAVDGGRSRVRSKG